MDGLINQFDKNSVSIINKYTQLAFQVEIRQSLIHIECYNQPDSKRFRKFILSSFIQKIPQQYKNYYDLKYQGIMLKEPPSNLPLFQYQPHIQVKNLLKKQFDQILCLKIGLSQLSKKYFEQILLQKKKKNRQTQTKMSIKQTIKFYQISKNQQFQQSLINQTNIISSKEYINESFINPKQKKYKSFSHSFCDNSFFNNFNDESFQKNINNQRQEQDSLTFLSNLNKNHEFFLSLVFNKTHKLVVQKLVKKLGVIKKQIVFYCLDEFINKLNVNFIYFQQIFQKIVQRQLPKFKRMIQSQNQFQLWGAGISPYKRTINDVDYPNLQGKFFLQFKIQGDLTNLHKLYQRIDQFFHLNQILIMTVESISCCLLKDVQNFVYNQKKQTVFLIGNVFICVLMSKKRYVKEKSYIQKYLNRKNNLKSFEQRLKKFLKTGNFVINLDQLSLHQGQQDFTQYQYKNENQYEGLFLLKNKKIREDYKKYLQNTCNVQFEYGNCFDNYITLLSDKETASLFQNKCKNFLVDMKIQTQIIKEFATQFQVYLFCKYLQKKFEDSYPGSKYVIKINKYNNKQQIYRQNYAKHTSSIITSLQMQKKQILKKVYYEISTCQKIKKKQWLNIILRPNSLLLQNFTCIKYSMIDKSKIYVLPFQSITRPLHEVIFLIDKNFKECWEFFQICKQNYIDLRVLQIQFSGKKKKKPEHLRKFILTKTKYVHNMIVWYNDMQKRNTTHRDSQISEIMNQFSKNQRLDIVLPHHAYKLLIEYIFPFFFQALLKQSGLRIKQIYIYYSNSPELTMNRQPGEKTIEDLIVKSIHQKFKIFQGRIQKINDLYLTNENIKKILAIKYVSLQWYAKTQQKKFKKYQASSLNSFVFFIQKQSKRRKTSMSEYKHKIPIFFQSQMFPYEILIDVNENICFEINEKDVKKGKFIQNHTELYKTILILKQIFKKATYLVLYRNENWNIMMQGYFWSNKQKNIYRQNQFEQKLILKHMKIDLLNKQIKINQQTDLAKELICQIYQNYIQNFNIIQAHQDDIQQLKNHIRQAQIQQNILKEIEQSEIYFQQKNQFQWTSKSQSILKNLG